MGRDGLWPIEISRLAVNDIWRYESGGIPVSVHKLMAGLVRNTPIAMRKLVDRIVSSSLRYDGKVRPYMESGIEQTKLQFFILKKKNNNKIVNCKKHYKNHPFSHLFDFFLTFPHHALMYFGFQHTPTLAYAFSFFSIFFLILEYTAHPHSVLIDITLTFYISCQHHSVIFCIFL